MEQLFKILEDIRKEGEALLKLFIDPN